MPLSRAKPLDAPDPWLPLYSLVFSPPGLCAFCVIDVGSASMYASGCRIGFVYGHITSGTQIPQRLIDALDPPRWRCIEPQVTESLDAGVDVAVYTCALRGDPVPYILSDPVAQAPTAETAACAYLSKFDESILDASLSSFTARVIALAARYPGERQRLLDGLISVHVVHATRIGVFSLLERVRDRGDVALSLNKNVTPPILTRMGPVEITGWLRHFSAVAAGAVTWTGQMASDFADFALPMLPGAIYLHATIDSDLVNETIILCFPDDSEAIRPEWLPSPPLVAPVAASNVIRLPVRGVARSPAVLADDPF